MELLVESDLPGFDHKRAHIYFGSWPDALAENKEHICGGTLFFRQICPTTFENYIEFVNNTYLYFDPVFRTRVAAY